MSLHDLLGDGERGGRCGGWRVDDVEQRAVPQDLEVIDDMFCVGLSFNQIPAKLEIPFAAITAFVDPAVDFRLQFQATVADMEPEAHEDAENDGGSDNDGDDDGGGSNVVTVDFGRKK